MERVLREFWKQRCELDKAREKYLTAIERVKMFDSGNDIIIDNKPLTKVGNHYLRRLNQVVCREMKQQYKQATKDYQKFLRSISNFSYT